MTVRSVFFALAMFTTVGCHRMPPQQAAAVPMKRHLVLTGTPCDSHADAVSVELQPVAFSEVLRLLSQMNDIAITSDVDLTGVTAEAKVTDVPWDCLLQDAAHQLGLEVAMSEEGVRLTRPSRRR